MNLIQESYQRLFPDKPFNYIAELEYNRRLADFNANIKLQHNTIKLSLNLQWKDIDDEIKMGLIQSLLLKILKQKQHTPNIELYNNFIKNIHILTPKTLSDPKLQSSFQRINEQFFHNQLEQPNLSWGQNAVRKLASYNFHNDSIVVSSVFRDASQEMIDYLVYHELLHKFHKFRHRNGRSSFHSKAFRYDERQFPHYERIEREINRYVRAGRKMQGRAWWRLF